MEISISTTQKKQVIDITEQLGNLISKQEIDSGISVIVVKHTTAAITTADLDPGTDLDLLKFLQAITPKMQWKHPHNPAHAPAHLLSSIIGCSLTLNIKNGAFDLGSWQRIILIELDGPRERNLSINFLKV